MDDFGIVIQAYDGSAEEFKQVRRALFGLLTLLIWEWLITLSFDVNYMRSSSPTLVKVVYFLSKSVAFVSQCGTLFTRHYIAEGYLTPTPQLCRKWTIPQITALSTVLYCLDLLLVVEVYALYQKSRYVCGWFGALATIKAVSMGIMLGLSIREIEFGPRCIPAQLSSKTVGFCIVEIVFHAAILALTLWRCRVLFRKQQRASRRLLKVVMRDTAFIFLTICGVYGLGIVQIMHASRGYMGVMIPLGVVFASVSTCRIIMNMRTLPASTMGSEERMDFTSVNDSEDEVSVTRS